MTEKISHHLTGPLLMAYSAGTLPEAFSLVVATHVSLCDACRAELESYEALGGQLLEEAGTGDETAAMSEGSLEAVMRMIEAAPQQAPAPARRDADIPTPLAGYIGGSLADVKWRPVGMGVRQAILPVAGDATARLLYIPAGTAIPDHGHAGTELTLVLRGAFEDGDDRFGPGDVEVAGEDLHHTPVAVLDQDCICLAATDAPLRFSGLLPRLAQPFLRI